MKAFKSPPIHRTPLYRAKASYSGMKARCLNANGKHPTYANVQLRMTIEEWLEWALPRYEKFIAERPDGSPAAARKGDSGHYEIGNIQIISNLENRAQQAMPAKLRPDGKKRCSRCKELKASNCFSKSKYQPDGLNHVCSPCNTLRMAEWRAKKKRTPSTTVSALAS